MKKYNDMKKELEKIITPDTVFACIGTKNAVFDSFGPLCGTLLKRKGVPCYGDCNDMMNAATMYVMLDRIYKKDGHQNKNIISIDACVTSSDKKLNKLSVRDVGVKPGAAVGCLFPRVGDNSIIMFTLTEKELRTTMESYKTYGLGSYVGRRYDLANRKMIREQAELVTDLIAEIYHEVCNEIIV